MPNSNSQAFSNPVEAQLPATEPAAPESPLSDALQTLNLAEDLVGKEAEGGGNLLDKIGSEVWDGYRSDLKSKESWDNAVDEWVKLAAQMKEEKSYPWPKASNVKYPLLATAAMQFAARAYPSLVPADGKVVQFKVVGADIQGMKAAKADKLAKHMNYQLFHEMPDWEEEMDRLLIQLPIVGCIFKKTYFDQIKKRNVSKLIGPKDLVVNYWATSLEDAHRKTEIIPMTKNKVASYRAAGVFLDEKDAPLPEVSPKPATADKMDVHGNQPPSATDGATPYIFLEQHTFWDLDDDGYAEPVIITIEEQSKKVFRIVARFDSDGIIENDDGDVITVEPVEYYTKYGFIPNPDGGFYDIGFGQLLGPINESTNTLVNILIDSGHLATLQAGFLGKGLRLKTGETRFSPGEWKTVNTTGDDIKKQVFPLPTAEPSDVLFKLLGLLVESGKELASVAEIFTGKMPGQNTPATTTQTAVEQGMKVFTAIYKRVYRAYIKEFKKLFRLNSIYQENFEKAQLILDEQIGPQDYDQKSYDVCPTADPSAVSTTQKMQKAQMLMEVLPLGTINPLEATKRILEGQEQPNIEALMAGAPGPQPDPKVQAMQEKTKMEREKHEMDMKFKQMELVFKQKELEMEMRFKEMEAKLDFQISQQEFQQKSQQQMQQAALDRQTAQIDAQTMKMTAQQEMEQADQQHKQTLKQGEESHKQKMTQQKEAASVAKQTQANKGTTGGVAKSASKQSSNKGSAK